MTTADLDRLEALAGAATAGPWRVEELPESGDPWWVLGPEVDGSSTLVGIHQHHNDADFCAASREAVPALVAEVRRLRAEVARLKEAK